jgi:hypothetical protein
MRYLRPIVTLLVFLACLCAGFWMALHKPLWGDEFYSQTDSIERITYENQFLGHIPEGGNAPLFYLIQKSFLQLIHYQTPGPWLQGHCSSDGRSQVLLRINPIIFMSLSVALVFYYFLTRYSWLTACYSLGLFFSSYMLWAYWAEARPYALLVFLTTLQSLILLNGIDAPSGTTTKASWTWLAIVNILLALTSTLSLGEILAVSVVWWTFKDRDWKKYMVVTLLPVLIVVFYYMHAPKYSFFFGSLSPEQLIRDNMSRQRFDILFIFLSFLSVYFLWRKKRLLNFIPGQEILKPIPYVVFTALMLASSAAVLCLLGRHAKEVPGGFPISSRYFIYLMPIGVITTTILAAALIKSFSRHYLMQALLVGLIGLLWVQNFLKIVPKAVHFLMH